MAATILAVAYVTLSLWARAAGWLFECAALLLASLAGGDTANTAKKLPMVFLNIRVLNRHEKLAEMESTVKAEVEQKVQGLGPFASLAAELAGKAAAGLSAMAVRDEDLGMSVGTMASTAMPALLEQVGILSDTHVVFAEGPLAVVQCKMLRVDLRVLLTALTSQSSVGVGVGRAWGFCWDACQLFGLGAFFERATEARVGELAAMSMTQLLSGELEAAVRDQFGGLEVAVTTVRSEEQAEHFFASRQALGMPVGVGRRH